MKLTVTKAELLSLLTRAVNATVEDVVITKGNPKLYEKVINAFKTSGCLDANGGIRPECKIQAIKQLRGEVYPKNADGVMIGLAESKWAIENWVAFTLFIQKRRRFPKITTSFPTFGTMTGTME